MKKRDLSPEPLTILEDMKDGLNNDDILAKFKQSNRSRGDQQIARFSEAERLKREKFLKKFSGGNYQK